MITQKEYLITLTTIEPFRIGAKEDPLSGADNPVTRVGGRLCIPGPSLKGSYRANLERWLYDEFFDRKTNSWKSDKVKPCIPSTKLTRDEDDLIKKKRFRGTACVYKVEKIDRRQQRDQFEPRDRSICPVCYLLGAQGLVGFISVPFLFSDMSYETLYSASRERATNIVKEGTNRPYQLTADNIKFAGVMKVLIKDDFIDWELGKARPLNEIPNADAWISSILGISAEWILENMIINRIKNITKLGGYGSKGFGGVSIEITEKK